MPWVRLALDAATIYGILHLMFWVRFGSGRFHSLLSPQDYDIYFKAFHWIALSTLFFLRYCGLYRLTSTLTFAEESWLVVKSVTIATVVLMATTFFIRAFTFSRTYLVLAGLAIAPAIALQRFLLGVIVMLIDNRRGSLRNVLLLGSETSGKQMIDYYRRNRRLATRVTAVLDDRLSVGSEFHGVPVLGRISELPAFLEKEKMIHEVVLSDRAVTNEHMLKILYDCEKEMVSFRWIADMFGMITAKMKVSYVGPVPALSFVDSPLADWENRFLKRSMDVILSVIGLVAALPIFGFIAWTIKKDSPGPVFFKQERVGQDGRHFMLYKFRTMRQDAEAATGPVWTKENDDRRTRSGALLRRTNLDELPQLWNVLKGDMSLVGPRPERPFFASQFKQEIPRYMARHSIRSGMSGWAQVNGLRGNTSIEERTQYDLYYIENWSLLLDIRILIMTLFARRNAY